MWALCSSLFFSNQSAPAAALARHQYARLSLIGGVYLASPDKVQQAYAWAYKTVCKSLSSQDDKGAPCVYSFKERRCLRDLASSWLVWAKVLID